MTAWTPPALPGTTAPPVVFNDFQYFFNNGTTIIPVDASDPNSAAPDAIRVFYTPEKTKGQLVMGLVSGAACTLVVWTYSTILGKWLKLGAAVSITTAYTASWLGTGINTVAIPDGVPVFIQVTVNDVSTGTKIVAAIFH